MTRDGLPAPNERLARMRKSFKRNKTVLTEDYEYFTTPDAPAKPHVSILRNNPRRLSSIQISMDQPSRYQIGRGCCTSRQNSSSSTTAPVMRAMDAAETYSLKDAGAWLEF